MSDPIAPGVESVPPAEIGGSLFKDYPLLKLLARGPLLGIMEKYGMTPTDFSGRNPYDMENSQYSQDALMKTMDRSSVHDKRGWRNMIEGGFNVAGREFGKEQQKLADDVASSFAMLAPQLAMTSPELLEGLGGRRGSSIVMAKNMFSGSRYRMDPISGSVGMDTDSISDMSNSVYEKLFVEGKLRDVKGFTAGNVGSMYNSLQSRGMLGGSDLRGSLEEITKSDLSDKPLSELREMLEDNNMASQVKELNTDKVTKSIKDYIGAIASVRDIFGENGNPNAPIPELFAALEKLTQGAVGKVSAGQLEDMVRTTTGLASMTGVPLQNLQAMQAHSANRAVSLGLDPVFGVQANQIAMAEGGAFRAAGGGSNPGWGRLTEEHVQQLSSNLSVGAAASRGVNEWAAILRMDDDISTEVTNEDGTKERVGFQKGTTAGNLVDALRGGRDYFHNVETGDKLQSIDMSRSQIDEMITGSTTASGASTGYRSSDFSRYSSQRYVNQGTILSANLTAPGRRAQSKSYESMIADWFSESLVTTLDGIGIKGEEAKEIANRVGPLMARDYLAASGKSVDSKDKQSAVIARSLKENLGKDKDRIEEAVDASGQDLEIFSYGAGANAATYSTTQIQNDSAMSSFKSVAGVHAMMSDEQGLRVLRLQSQADVQGIVRKSLSGLNSTSAMRSVTQAMMDVKEGEPDSVKKVLGSVFGDRKDKVQGPLTGIYDRIEKLKKESDLNVENLSKINGPGDVEKYRERAKEISDAIEKEKEKLSKIFDDNHVGEGGFGEINETIFKTESGFQLGMDRDYGFTVDTKDSGNLNRILRNDEVMEFLGRSRKRKSRIEDIHWSSKGEDGETLSVEELRELSSKYQSNEITLEEFKSQSGLDGRRAEEISELFGKQKKYGQDDIGRDKEIDTMEELRQNLESGAAQEAKDLETKTVKLEPGTEMKISGTLDLENSKINAIAQSTHGARDTVGAHA